MLVEWLRRKVLVTIVQTVVIRPFAYIVVKPVLPLQNIGLNITMTIIMMLLIWVISISSSVLCVVN